MRAVGDMSAQTGSPPATDRSSLATQSSVAPGSVSVSLPKTCPLGQASRPCRNDPGLAWDLPCYC